MLTKEELNEIKKRCKKATPGPWIVDECDSGVVLDYKPERKRTRGYGCGNTFVCDLNDGEYHEYVNIKEQKANVEFIAKARQDIPALIEEVERLRERENWLIKYAAQFVILYCPMPEDYICLKKIAGICCSESLERRERCLREATAYGTRKTRGGVKKWMES